MIKFMSLLSFQVLAKRHFHFKQHQESSNSCQNILARAKHVVQTQDIIHLPIPSDNASSPISIHDQSVELWYSVMNSTSSELENFQQDASQLKDYLNRHIDGLHVSDDLMEEVLKLQQTRISCTPLDDIAKFKEIYQIIDYDFSNHDANHDPKIRQLQSQMDTQFEIVKTTMALQHSFNTLLDQFLWLVLDEGKKMNHDRDDGVKWLPNLVSKILGSKMFSKMARFFDRYKNRSPKTLKQEIQVISAVVLFLHHFRGTPYFRKAFDFIQDNPLMMTIYSQLVKPVVKQVKDNIVDIKSKIDIKDANLPQTYLSAFTMTDELLGFQS